MPMCVDKLIDQAAEALGRSRSDHHRDRVRHVPPQAARRCRMGNCAHGEAIIGRHPCPGAHHIGTGSAAGFILRGPPPEPVIQKRFAGIELRKLVFRGEFPRSAKRIAAQRSHGGLVSSSRRSLGLSFGGWSSIAVNRLNAASESTKYRRSSSTASASRHAVSSIKSDRLRSNASAAWSMSAFCLRLARKLIVSPRPLSARVCVPGIVVLLLYIHSCCLSVRTLSTHTSAPCGWARRLRVRLDLTGTYRAHTIHRIPG